jgi:hypothetical protein
VRAAEVIDALRRRYRLEDGEWLFWTEAWRIDAYAMRCWPSGVGHRRVALEVKCSRGDFRSEIKRPEKRRNALDLSHEFYFVVPRDLVQAHEVPPECGLMYVLPSGKTRIVKKAPVRKPRSFTLEEAIYLMRTPLYRDGILEMRRRIVIEQQISEQFAARADHLDDALKRAHERLLALNGHLITVGSTWRGTFQPYSWMPPISADVYVEQIRAETLVVRRLDNGETFRIWHLADLLANYAPLDMAAVA